MDTEKQEPGEIAAMVENTLVQFNDAMKSQEELSLRTDRRNSQIIRYGVSTIILLAIGIAFLTWSLKHDMNKMSGYMEAMARDVSTMSNATTQMQISMNTIDGGINKVVSHTQAISSLFVETDSSVAVLSHIGESVGLMQSHLRGLNKSVENMNSNIRTINKQMRTLNRNLGTMGHDVNRMSSPVKMFPFNR
jgi:uncharacterized protein YoxC